MYFWQRCSKIHIKQPWIDQQSFWNGWMLSFLPSIFQFLNRLIKNYQHVDASSVSSTTDCISSWCLIASSILGAWLVAVVEQHLSNLQRLILVTLRNAMQRHISFPGSFVDFGSFLQQIAYNPLVPRSRGNDNTLPWDTSCCHDLQQSPCQPPVPQGNAQHRTIRTHIPQTARFFCSHTCPTAHWFHHLSPRELELSPVCPSVRLHLMLCFRARHWSFMLCPPPLRPRRALSSASLVPHQHHFSFLINPRDCSTTSWPPF